MANEATRGWHFNPETGKTGVCQARIKCDFAEDGVNPPHFATEAEARAAYNNTMDDKTIAVVFKKDSKASKNTVSTADQSFSKLLSTSRQELKTADNEAKWLENKAVAVIEAQEDVSRYDFGTKERAAARDSLRLSREAYLAAELASIESSPMFDPSMSEKLQKNAQVVWDESGKLEKALADHARIANIASQSRLSQGEVTALLETLQEDYTRPRSPRVTPLGGMAEDKNYCNVTATAFRIAPESVSRVLESVAS